MHDVVDALRHATGVHHFAEQRRGRGRFLGRLADDGVAADQRRRGLPGQRQDGQVPGRDAGHHTQRLARGVVDQLAAVGQVGLEEVAVRCLAQVGKDAEVGDAAVHVQLARLRQGAAGVGDLGGQKVVEAPLDDVGHAVQGGRALLHRAAAPFAFNGLARRAHRAVHQGGVGLVHLGQHAAGERADIVEGPVGGDEGAVHVIADFLERGRQRKAFGHGGLQQGGAPV